MKTIIINLIIASIPLFLQASTNDNSKIDTFLGFEFGMSQKQFTDSEKLFNRDFIDEQAIDIKVTKLLVLQKCYFKI